MSDFDSSDLCLGVIGLGYVGLPLAVEAAEAGLHVIGFDTSETIVEGVEEGRSHIPDLDDEQLSRLRRAGRLEATVDDARMAECDALSICVPTPLSKTRDPDISFILSATNAVAKSLRPGQLVVLESTTYPGTTRDVVLPALERNGMTVGEDFFLCFSPERVDPGNVVWKTRNTPKVIGGITEGCLEAGLALYGRFIDTLIPVSSTEAAELTKILENMFRAVNIGLVNETAIIADRLGVDIWEVIDAATTKPFGFMKFVPGPGLGGHCIPVDPQYLSWKMRTLDYRTRFIELASDVNSEMPRFVAGKVREALNLVMKPVNGSRVLVLGVAYKKDVDDVRESPAIDVMNLLEADGAHVSYHDPYVPTIREENREWISVPLDDGIAEADAVVILTDHSSFDYARILQRSRVLVDTRNATAGLVASNATHHPQRWIVKAEGDR
jgi:UDP-N-acetyl-D-glucosamine dehydrogenase